MRRQRIIGILIGIVICGAVILTSVMIARAQPAPPIDPIAKARSQRAPPGPPVVDQGQLPRNELGVVQPTDAPNTPPSKFEFVLTPQDKAMWAQVLTGLEACIGSVRVISRNETCGNLFIFLEQFNKRVQEAQAAQP